LIEPRRDDTKASVREPVADLNDTSIKKLRFVDGYDVGLFEDALFDARARGDSYSVDADGFVADDAMGVVTIIDPRFEGLDALTGEDRSLDSADQLFGFSTEHRARNDLNGPERTSRYPAHGGRQTADGAVRQGERESRLNAPVGDAKKRGNRTFFEPLAWPSCGRPGRVLGEHGAALLRRVGERDKTASKSGSVIVQLALFENAHARMTAVQVVLRKLGRGSRAVVGRLVRAPRKGSVVVIEFSDGMHEYVTTPVKRVLRLAGREVFYIETVNSRYRLEVRGREVALDGAVGGS
jgi:hypothetical protein